MACAIDQTFKNVRNVFIETTEMKQNESSAKEQLQAFVKW